MANWNISIPDDIAPTVARHVSDEYGYEEQIPNEAGEMIDNPLSRAAFAKRAIIAHVKDIVRRREGIAAAEAARVTAEERAIADTSTIS